MITKEKPLVAGKQSEGLLNEVHTPIRKQNNTSSVEIKPKNAPAELIIKKNEPLVSSRYLAKRLGVRPRHTFRLIQKYQSEIKDLGVLRFENVKGNNGRPQKFALLNEEQSVFILTLSKNTMSVVALKKDLSWQFVAYRKLMIQKQQARLNGKKRRRDLTDSIKILVGLAKSNGSKNADKYYISITNMIYKQVFSLKKVPALFRDNLSKNELYQLQLVEWKIAEWLKESIDSCLDYHEPYAEIKKKLKNLVAVIGVINLNRQIAA